MDQSLDQQANEEKLPFEPRTLVMGLWRRRWVMLGIMVLAVGLGLGVSIMFGTRIYESRTVMLFKAGAGMNQMEERKQALKTILNLVKIEANLRKLRQKLKLQATLSELSQRIDIYEQDNTGLVVFKARWTDAKTSSDIANNLREIFQEFMENRRKKRKSSPDKQATALREQLTKAQEALKQADKKLQSFITVNRIVNLDKQINWSLEEKTHLGILYEEASIEKKTVDLQMANLDKIIGDLTQKAQTEAAASKAASEGLGEMNIRFRRLRDAIHDDRWNRAQAAELAQLESEYRRTKRLYEKGVATKAELEKKKNALDKQKALSVDTDKIKEWKQEIAELDKVVIPKGGKSTTPSSKLLYQMMLRYFDVELKHVSLAEKVKHLESAKLKIQTRLDDLTRLQAEFMGLQREVKAREQDKANIQKLFSELKTTQRPESSQLELVSKASPPVYRSKSNRKLIAIAVTMGISLMGFCVLLALELLDTTIKSTPELRLKLNIPVYGQLEFKENDDLTMPLPDYTNSIQVLGMVASRLRRKMPQKGAKVLVTSALSLEGKTLITAHLAAHLGKRNEKILIIEASKEPLEQSLSLQMLISDSESDLGLSDYLGDKDLNSEKVIQKTYLENVWCLPKGLQNLRGEQLASRRLRELLIYAGENFSLVIIDGPSVLSGLEAGMICSLVDGIFMVIRAQKAKTGELKRAQVRLEDSGKEVVGCLTNAVKKPFVNMRS